MCVEYVYSMLSPVCTVLMYAVQEGLALSLDDPEAKAYLLLSLEKLEKVRSLRYISLHIYNSVL